VGSAVIDPTTDMLIRRAASVAARATHQRIHDSHSDRDPDIETGSIDANGNLLPSQGTLSIPQSMWQAAPYVLIDKPDLGANDIVLFIWADQGQNRRAYVIGVLGEITPWAETATISGAALTTARGTTIDAANWSRTLATTNTADGSGVVILWADLSGLRKAYAIAEL
jgi:hypothetical protein